MDVRSGRELLLGLLRHPLAFIAFILDAERLRYLLLLLGALAFLPLFALRPLAGALPILAINLLSSFPGVLRLESHYTTAIVPFIVGAGLIGAGRLRVLVPRFFRGIDAHSLRLPRAIAGILLAAVTAMHVAHGGSPLSVLGDRFKLSLFEGGARVATIRQKLATVPAAARLSTPGRLAARSGADFPLPAPSPP